VKTLWSRRGIPIISPASKIFLVICLSSSEGITAPEGWLWQTIIADALSLTALQSTSLGWTIVLFTSPMLTIETDITLWALFKVRRE